MNSRQLLSLYGLKWNPFSPELPIEALVETPAMENFFWRVENLVLDGGFALITGESGLGKSVALRLLYERLTGLRDITVAAITRPQSGLADFYRELGMLFGIELRTSNRWGGFEALRAQWKNHIETTLFRPVLLVDEAQETDPAVLSELRILSSTHFDSKIILTTVICGDGRLADKFRTKELVPLGTRIRTRLELKPRSGLELAELLKESVSRAGGSSRMMTKELAQVLAEHAAGSPRVMMNTANELLMVAGKKDRKQLDEKLYFEVFYPEQAKQKRRK